MKYDLLAPIHYAMKEQALSERVLAHRVGLSRSTLRRVMNADGVENTTLRSLEKLASHLGHSLSITFSNAGGSSEHSVAGTGVNIKRDGFSSWKVHLMNMVDEFRRHRNPLLLVLPPPLGLDKKMEALLASTVCHLCDESKMRAPKWAGGELFFTQALVCFRDGIPQGDESARIPPALQEEQHFRSRQFFGQGLR